jgi:signal transduction histidine kinase
LQSGLIPALREMASRINDSAKVNVRVTSLDVPERMTELHEISMYRIIQEWINNVLKYAGASTIEIQIIGYEEEVNVVIEDDGSGFNANVLESSKGNGWKNIRSRLNLVRGTIHIDSRPERRGTTVIVRIPFMPEPAGVVVVDANTQ